MRGSEVLSAVLLSLCAAALGASGAGQAQDRRVRFDGSSAQGTCELARALSGPVDGSVSPSELAYTACLDKQEGMACRVAFDHLQFDGSCVLALDQRLICLPDAEPGGR